MIIRGGAIMGLLDKLTDVGSVLSSKGMEAANKAKEMGGISQLKIKISSAEGHIKTAYTELGEKLFTEKADFLAENYPDIVEKIKGFQTEIEGYLQEIETLKQTTADANAKLQEDEKNRKAAQDGTVQSSVAQDSPVQENAAEGNTPEE